MSKTTYWITTAEGTYGQVEGVEERDRWTPLGWTVAADEPAPTDFVWMRKDGIDRPARFAYGAASTWQDMGWKLSAPPEHVDVTKDPKLFDQPKEKAKPSTSAATAPSSPKPETVTPK
jgi:hypothetical protein